MEPTDGLERQTRLDPGAPGRNLFVKGRCATRDTKSDKFEPNGNGLEPKWLRTIVDLGRCKTRLVFILHATARIA